MSREQHTFEASRVIEAAKAAFAATIPADQLPDHVLVAWGIDKIGDSPFVQVFGVPIADEDSPVYGEEQSWEWSTCSILGTKVDGRQIDEFIDLLTEDYGRVDRALDTQLAAADETDYVPGYWSLDGMSLAEVDEELRRMREESEDIPF